MNFADKEPKYFPSIVRFNPNVFLTFDLELTSPKYVIARQGIRRTITSTIDRIAPPFNITSVAVDRIDLGTELLGVNATAYLDKESPGAGAVDFGVLYLRSKVREAQHPIKRFFVSAEIERLTAHETYHLWQLSKFPRRMQQEAEVQKVLQETSTNFPQDWFSLNSEFMAELFATKHLLTQSTNNESGVMLNLARKLEARKRLKKFRRYSNYADKLLGLFKS